MTKLRVLLAPHPDLSKITEPVTEVNDEVRTKIADMKETMYEDSGIGLAANQVGILQRIIVMDVGGDNSLTRVGNPIDSKCYVFVNPIIESTSKDVVEFEEYCMSLPGVGVLIERPIALKLRYLDEEGKEYIEDFSGLMARCIQHEIDHLDGKTTLFYLSKLKKERALKKIAKHYANDA